MNKIINRLPRIEKKYRYAAYVCIFFCFLFMRNTYKEGDTQLIDQNGNVLTSQKSLDAMSHIDNNYYDDYEEPVYEYNKCNLMPSWSMFYHEKYGLINIETGLNTGAKYDGRLCFDKENIAYDYDRHFITTNGEEVVKVPYIVKAKTSFRQVLLNTLLDSSNTNDSYRHTFLTWESLYERGKFIETSNFTYFANGVAAYHTDYNDRYGLISEDGTLITLPKYSYINGKRDFEVSMVINYNRTELDVINNRGKSVVGDAPSSVTFFDEAKLIGCGTEFDGELYKYDGTQIEGVFHDFKSSKTGDVDCFLKYYDSNREDGGLMVFYKDSDPIFYSDLYRFCYAYADENGNITYLVVEDQSSKHSLIDLNGNLICPGSYSDILTTSEYDTFIGINDDERIDILHLDGTVIKTDYKYADKGNTPTTILVKKMDDDTLFSYMNLNGYLVHGWFTKDEK